jgi:hypothetical protein
MESLNGICMLRILDSANAIIFYPSICTNVNLPQLKAAGVSVATQNCTNINSTFLEEVYSRLHFYDAISEAESFILSVYPHLKFVNPIELCAWMNGRVLDNCMDSETYNETVRDTLNNFCKRRPCIPQICQLN